MTRKRGEHGVIILTAVFFIAFTILTSNLFRIAVEQKNVAAAATEGTFTLQVGECQGTVYDRNIRPLINADTELLAAAVPLALDRESTAEYAIDKEKFLAEFDKGLPFVFECTDKAL